MRAAAAAPAATAAPRAANEAEHLAARKTLSCVARLDGRYAEGRGGGRAARLAREEHPRGRARHAPTYGLLGEYSQDELTRLINALIVAGCVRQGGGAYPTVSLTELGREGDAPDRRRVALDLEAVAADTSIEVDAGVPGDGGEPGRPRRRK